MLGLGAPNTGVEAPTSFGCGKVGATMGALGGGLALGGGGGGGSGGGLDSLVAGKSSPRIPSIDPGVVLGTPALASGVLMTLSLVSFFCAMARICCWQFCSWLSKLFTVSGRTWAVDLELGLVDD